MTTGDDRFLQPILDLQRALAAAFAVGLSREEIDQYVDNAEDEADA